MKTRIKWIVALVAVVVGVAWLLGDRVLAESREPSAEGDRVTELEKEVQSLRDTVARLEQRLAAVEEKNGVRVLQLTKDDVRSFPPQAVPRAPWMQQYRPQGEINGVPYYVIPLKNQPATTQPALAPPPADGQP